MENTKEPCIICFEENQEKILFDCNHSICLVCYSKLLENDNATCPVCRQKIDNPAKPIPIYIHVAEPIPIPNPILRNRTMIGPKSILCLISVIVIVVIILIITSKYH